MNNLEKIIWKFFSSVVAITVLTTGASAQITQSQYDAVVSCCWGIGSKSAFGRYCAPTSWGVCRDSQAYCSSSYLFQVESLSDGRLPCGIMAARGADSDLTQLFVPPGPQTLSDGRILEVSDGVANGLRAATVVMQMKERGASNDELIEAIDDNVEVSVEDAVDGKQVFTIRGEGIDDIVLRFDSQENLQQEGEDE